MKSALLAVVGVSILAATAACDSGSDGGTGGSGGSGVIPIPNGGSASTAGSGTTPTAGSGTTPMAGSGTGGTGSSGGAPAAGVPLTPTDGWIAADSNALMIQGAVFDFADDFTKAGPPMMTADLTAGNACIKGVAAMVVKTCTPPTGMDCYGVYWGAALGLNLNQPNVPDPMDPTMMIGGDPLPFDATAIKGFAFEIAAPAGGAGMIPATSALRFKVDDGTGKTEGEFCTGKETPVKLGENLVTFDKLRTKCWEDLAKQPTPSLATSMQSKLVKVSWQVVTNDKATVPFDFCVNNIRAIQ